METILVQVLTFIGTNVAGGLTWDAIKGAGSRLASAFRKRFTDEKHFKDEEQAEEFFKSICCDKPFHKLKPYENVWGAYNNCTGLEASDSFKSAFKSWIKEMGPDLAELAKSPQSEGGIRIGTQIITGNTEVNFIGSQNNYGVK